jgi:hypothetical protein
MEAFKEAAKNAEHIFVKNADGTIFCETHLRDAKKMRTCTARRSGL